jgi:hypothetical protein
MGMLDQFIKHCLFFKSNELFHYCLGALGWCCIVLLIYALVSLFSY